MSNLDRIFNVHEVSPEGLALMEEVRASCRQLAEGNMFAVGRIHRAIVAAPNNEERARALEHHRVYIHSRSLWGGTELTDIQLADIQIVMFWANAAIARGED